MGVIWYFSQKPHLPFPLFWVKIPNTCAQPWARLKGSLKKKGPFMQRSTLRLQLFVLCTLVLTFIFSTPARPAMAAERCFAETSFCIDGRIREFWEQNGGLTVFGFPIGPQESLTVDGSTVIAQRFERNRLELHPENPRPYDVLLGRLGADRLAQQGRDWYAFPKSADSGGCQTFADTGHAVCGAILAAWQSNGLQLDTNPAVSYAESLALFGLPLSGLISETLSDGQQYQVQWFERARFELHPENAAPYDVLLGLLGNELAQPATPTTTRVIPATAAPLHPLPDLMIPPSTLKNIGYDVQQAGTTTWGVFFNYTSQIPGAESADLTTGDPWRGMLIDCNTPQSLNTIPTWYQRNGKAYGIGQWFEEDIDSPATGSCSSGYPAQIRQSYQANFDYSVQNPYQDGLRLHVMSPIQDIQSCQVYHLFVDWQEQKPLDYHFINMLCANREFKFYVIPSRAADGGDYDTLSQDVNELIGILINHVLYGS